MTRRHWRCSSRTDGKQLHGTTSEADLKVSLSTLSSSRRWVLYHLVQLYEFVEQCLRFTFRLKAPLSRQFRNSLVVLVDEVDGAYAEGWTLLP